MSPSQSPANRGGASNSGANAPYGIGHAYGGSPSSGRYVSTPQYQTTIGTSRPGMTQPTAPGAKPAGGMAYNPANAGGADGAQNSDSSDDDQ